jgi:hypothetical protein
VRVGADYDSSGEVEGRLKRLGQGAESARKVRRASRQRDVNEQGSIVGGREDGGLFSRALQPKRE